MKEKTIEVDGKSYTIRELKYKDLIAVADKGKEEVAKTLLISSTKLSDEEYEELSMITGIKLMTAVNEFNGLIEGDFPVATQIKD